jgi:polysaccharide export outer membrane protein
MCQLHRRRFNAFHRLVMIAVVFCCLGLAAQQTAPLEPQEPQAAAETQLSIQAEIRIGSGDLLEIKIFGVPDLSQEARVGTNGDISVNLVGPVNVAGSTTNEAQQKIASLMQERGFLNNPQVTVLVKEYATQGISVLGEVAKPGIYPLLGQRRLFDVISAAGGTTQRAGRTITISHRADPENPVVIEMSTEPAKSAATNVEVLPGDTVLVSRAGVVYVVGDVARPSGFTMDSNERMTVLQAIAMAGGTNGTAALDSSKILRRSAQGVQEIPIPLSKLLSAKATDQPLQAEDVLFVPKSLGKSVARRSAEAILQVATGLAIYGRY